jgi:hypothetical protein
MNSTNQLLVFELDDQHYALHFSIAVVLSLKQADATAAGSCAFVLKHRMYSDLIPAIKAALECPDDSKIPSLKEVKKQKNSDKKN